MATAIADNPERSRYELLKDGTLAGFIDYGISDGTISMFHEEVAAEFGGQGIGSQLARAALEDARARGLLVAPLCPFVAAYVSKHPDEYRDLVTPAFRLRL